MDGQHASESDQPQGAPLGPPDAPVSVSQANLNGAPDAGPSTCTENANNVTTKLDLSTGLPVALDHLGPMVVAEDGQLSRIANWTEMTSREQEVALRRIGARNRSRLEALRQAGVEPLAALTPKTPEPCLLLEG